MFSFLSGVTLSLAQEPGVIWVGVSSIPCISLFPLFSSATPRHWQSWSWSGSTGTRNVSGIYRMELLLPIPTWSPSARCVFAGNKGNFGLMYWIHPCGFQEPSVAISNLICLLSSVDGLPAWTDGFLSLSKALRLIWKLGCEKDLCYIILNKSSPLQNRSNASGELECSCVHCWVCSIPPVFLCR